MQQRDLNAWRERFDAYVARKTRAATAHELWPYTTDVAIPDPHVAAIGNNWSSRLFDGPFYVSDAADAQRAACSLVFVQSADGNTGGDDPEVLGGGATDKHLIYEGLSRVAVDAVLAGAETVRGTDLVFSVWHPELVSLRQSLGLARHPVQVVATRRGLDIENLLLFNLPEVRAVAVTTPSGAEAMRGALVARPWVTLLITDRSGALDVALQQLRRLGVARVSCVGGRHLARQLLEARLVEDLYLTTSAVNGGEPDTPLYPGELSGRTVLRKRGTGPEAGVIFEHVAGPRPCP